VKDRHTGAVTRVSVLTGGATPSYSALSAPIGSTRAARRAGR
jgi:hypothetical protein